MIRKFGISGLAPLPKVFSLEGIGKINWICGRNNSGKSTLLRALAQSHPNTRPLAYSFQGESLRRFRQAVDRRAPWSGLAGASQKTAEITAFAVEMAEASRDKGWERQQAQLLAADLVRRLRQNQLLMYQDSNWIVECFNESLGWFQKPLLIPPSRRLKQGDGERKERRLSVVISSLLNGRSWRCRIGRRINVPKPNGSKARSPQRKRLESERDGRRSIGGRSN
jgi:energy-coupling factor transporter ATP-binding protein EcfA2